MKIIDKTSKEEQSFDSLQTGDVFKYDGALSYIKVYGGYDAYNAYDLINARLTNFTPDMKVKKVNAEIILHDAGWEG